MRSRKVESGAPTGSGEQVALELGDRRTEGLQAGARGPKAGDGAQQADDTGKAPVESAAPRKPAGTKGAVSPRSAVAAVAKKKAATRAKKRAPRASERERASLVIERLHEEMPDARIELDFSNDLELLVAVILSAQCTDAMVNRCTPSLFEAFPTAAAYAAAQPEDLHEHISRCGLYRNKAKNIVAAMQKIEREYGGELPTTRALLEELPGVGRKTAGVVAVYAFDGQAFPVDTHVGRLARRMGFTREENPDKVEEDMQRLLPPSLWGSGHQLLVWHGRRCCYARKPACSRCVVADLCPKRGVRDAV